MLTESYDKHMRRLVLMSSTSLTVHKGIHFSDYSWVLQIVGSWHGLKQLIIDI